MHFARGSVAGPLGDQSRHLFGILICCWTVDHVIMPWTAAPFRGLNQRTAEDLVYLIHVHLADSSLHLASTPLESRDFR